MDTQFNLWSTADETTIFSYVTSCVLVTENERFKSDFFFHLTLKVAPAGSSETFVPTYQTTRRQVREDNIFDTYRRDGYKC